MASEQTEDAGNHPEPEAPTFAAILREFSGAFVTAKRNDGTEFTKRRDDAPSWIDTDVMLAIHRAVDDRMPDDWIYEQATSFADTLTGYTCEDADEARDHVHEIADGMVDVYTADRMRWLSSHLGNVALCDEAAEEYGQESADMADRVAGGQYLALTRIANAVIDAIESELSDRS